MIQRTVVVAVCILTALLTGTSPADGQILSRRTLRTAQQRSQIDFTRVVGVRELANGSVIVVDELETSVYLLNDGLSAAGQVGREGAGPGEYTWPSQIIPLPGDSTAIRDAPNNRFLVLGPDGSPSSVRDLHGRPLGSPQLPIYWPRASAADELGYFYGQGTQTQRRTDGSSVVVDSAAIHRWRSDSAVLDTVAHLPVRNAPGTTAGPSGLLVHLGGSPMPFKTAPEWAVASDGWLAIVYDAPYHVLMIGPDGTRHVGPPITHQPLDVTDGHKREWCAEQERPRAWLIGGRPGGPPSRVQVRHAPCTEPDRWPARLPPFLPQALRFAYDGKLWIQRTVEAGSPTVFDVVDRTGQRIEQIQLPPNRRLVGFGAHTVYLVVKDEVDLEYLERYEIGS